MNGQKAAGGDLTGQPGFAILNSDNLTYFICLKN